MYNVVHFDRKLQVLAYSLNVLKYTLMHRLCTLNRIKNQLLKMWALCITVCPHKKTRLKSITHPKKLVWLDRGWIWEWIKAVNEGLELLRETQSSSYDTEAHTSPKIVSQEPTSQSDTFSKELKARLEEKDKQIEEKDRYIETLKVEVEKAGHDKETIQNLYNNYILQMQTLVNQKAIEAPGAKKPWWRFW